MKRNISINDKSRKHEYYSKMNESIGGFTNNKKTTKKNSKKKMNEALQVEIDSITPFWIKVKRTMSPRILELRARFMGGI